ncbi:MAG: DUF3631 domain-containing protein [Candidatus Planktophila sp.]|nr:DUF3631 domain-containing protein [Candidatus Planktophila sp.]
MLKYGNDYDDDGNLIGGADFVTDVTDVTDESPKGGAALLHDVETFLSRFIVYPGEAERIAHVLWIGHTWFMDQWESTPRIAFLSPEPSSGKSRALEVTEPLVPRPIHAVNVSPSYLFRKVSDPDGPPTVLYDEIDTVFGPKAKENEELRGLLNAGHRKGAFAGRCVVRGKNIETEDFPAYCAVALAGLDDLPDTIMTRSVVVRMRRRAPGEIVAPWRLRVEKKSADALNDQLLKWSNQNQHTINTWPQMPEGVEDRNADVWEALLAVADLAGGYWPERARKAAVEMVTDSRTKQPSLGLILLSDLRDAFIQRKVDRLTTVEILQILTSLEESPWGDLRGKPLDARSLSTRLRKYDVKPETFRIGEATFKGYLTSAFSDAWPRYLSPLLPTDLQVTAVTPVTESQESEVSDIPDLFVTPVTDVTYETAKGSEVIA